jgi:leucyl/phenylalanyl-tRNA--protein transferase
MLRCADHPETWITPEFVDIYTKLHEQGHAHSVEISYEGKLVGGVYGPSVGAAFFAESMFHSKTDASKLALYFLVEKLKASGFQLLEVQFLTAHLSSLGAVEISDEEYIKRLDLATHSEVSW